MAIDNRKIRNLEQIIQYRFSQPDLAWEALRAANPYDPAPATENMPSAADGNSGLAIVGQAVMNHELAVEWYHDVKLPGHGSVSREKFREKYNNVRADLNLQAIGRRFGLQFQLVNVPVQDYGVNNITMARAVEAILGAVSLDDCGPQRGMAAVTKIMQMFGMLAPDEEEEEEEGKEEGTR